MNFSMISYCVSHFDAVARLEEKHGNQISPLRQLVLFLCGC